MVVRFQGRMLFSVPTCAEDGFSYWDELIRERAQSARGNDVSDRAGLADTPTPQYPIKPLLLDRTSPTWRIWADREAGVAIVRVEKALRFTGDRTLFDLCPDSALCPPPRGIVTDTHIVLAASAPDAHCGELKAAIDNAERVLKSFVAWLNQDIAAANAYARRRREALPSPREEKGTGDPGDRQRVWRLARTPFRTAKAQQRRAIA